MDDERRSGRLYSDAIPARVRQLVDNHLSLGLRAGQLSEHASLYDAGMTSHASVELMLLLEDHFDIEFPDDMLRRDVFETLASISAAVDELSQPASADVAETQISSSAAKPQL